VKLRGIKNPLNRGRLASASTGRCASGFLEALAQLAMNDRPSETTAHDDCVLTGGSNGLKQVVWWLVVSRRAVDEGSCKHRAMDATSTRHGQTSHLELWFTQPSAAAPGAPLSLMTGAGA
jgi:hypothetical protein